MQNLWNLPNHRYEEFKNAYNIGNWLWLISIWNEYNVTTTKLCAGCPDSIDTVKKGFEQWFEVLEKQI